MGTNIENHHPLPHKAPSEIRLGSFEHTRNQLPIKGTFRG
jgi:hypothetical protein